MPRFICPNTRGYKRAPNDARAALANGRADHLGAQRHCATLFCLAVLMLSHASPARALDRVVGNGTAASCNEAAFDGALNVVLGVGAGSITFNCGGPASILFTSEKRIEFTNGFDPAITIDGGGAVTLSGGGSTSLFSVLAAADYPSLLHLRNITLTAGLSSGDGGAIYSTGTLILDNVTIQDSHSSSSGGAIANRDGNVTINNSIIRDNSAVAYGGGVNSSGTLTIRASRIEGNRVEGSGGNCNGGGLSATGAITIAASQVISNSAPSQAGRGGKGGGICFGTGELTISSTRIAGNSAAEGGGIAVFGAARVERTQLVSNTALLQSAMGGAGGAIWSAGHLTLLDVQISGNASFDGGGVYQDRAGRLTVSHSAINQNTATGFGGGGIYVRGDGLRQALGTGQASIADSSLRDNSALLYGGGLFNNGGVVDVVRSEFLRNHVLEVAPFVFGGGGGIFVANGYLALDHSAVRLNSSATGGGGMAVGGFGVERQYLNNVAVSASTFASNTATGSGGAIAIWEDAGMPPAPVNNGEVPIVYVSDSTFSNNSSAIDGGAVYNANAFRAINSTFSGNRAAQRGGALMGYGRTAPDTNLSQSNLAHSTFMGNRADGNGGTIALDAGVLAKMKSSVIADSKVSQNCAGSLVNLGGNASSDNSCGLPVMADVDLTPLGDHGGPTHTHLPLAGSPLLDAGLCGVQPATDQRGQPRVHGAACDIGAVERQPDEGIKRIKLPLIVK